MIIWGEKKMFSLLSVKNAALKFVRIYLSQAFSTCFCSKAYCSLNQFLILKLMTCGNSVTYFLV